MSSEQSPPPVDSSKLHLNFVAGGTVQAGNGVYVKRPADDVLLSLCLHGEFAFVLTSRQMGKSSLMVHTVEKLLSVGIHPAIIDLTAIGLSQVTAEQWYSGIIEEITQQLSLPPKASIWWQQQQQLSIAHRFTQFLSDIVLKEVVGRVVLFIDEIDTTLGLDFTDDFFASIRFLYNARATNPDLKRLSFVLLGVASPGDLIKDRERTPFNIGTRVELTDFEQADAIIGLGVDPEQVRQVFEYTGGHPYLTLKVFQSVAAEPLKTTLEPRMQKLFLGEKGRKDSNIEFVSNSLIGLEDRRESLLRRYIAVSRGRSVPDTEGDPVCTWLHLSGVVKTEKGMLVARNSIYQRVFDETWARNNLKTNWVRRLAWTTGATASLLLVLILVLVLVTFKLGANAKRDRSESDRARKDAINWQTEAYEWRGEVAKLKSMFQDTQSGLEDTQGKLRSSLSELDSKKQEFEGVQRQLNGVEQQLSQASQESRGYREKIAKVREDFGDYAESSNNSSEKGLILERIKKDLDAPAVSLAPLPTMLPETVPRLIGLQARLIFYVVGDLPKFKPRGGSYVLLRPEIYIDGNPYALAIRGTSFEVHLPPGFHDISVGDPNLPTSISHERRVFVTTQNITYLKLQPDQAQQMYETQPGVEADVKGRALTGVEKVRPELIF